mgnify:CR=1 FL=1
MQEKPEWKILAETTGSKTGRALWVYEDSDGRNVYQMTFGDQPTSNGGYHELDSLLKLKNMTAVDLDYSVSAGKAPRY